MTVTDEMVELKPCPFCGGAPVDRAIEAHTHSAPIKALGIPDHPGSHVVECSCGAGLIDDTREEVVTRWNRRAASPEGGATAKRELRIKELEGEISYVKEWNRLLKEDYEKSQAELASIKEKQT